MPVGPAVRYQYRRWGGGLVWPELVGCACLSVRAAAGACVGRIDWRYMCNARPE